MDPQRFAKAAEHHLDEEEALLTSLLACLDAERQALVALDGTEMARLTEEKERLVARERMLAESRRALISEAAASISEQTGGSAVDLSLGEIVARLRPPGAPRLLRRRERVRGLAADAQRRNAINRQLTVHALSCIRGVLAISGRAVAHTYGPTGRVAQVALAGGYARRV